LLINTAHAQGWNNPAFESSGFLTAMSRMFGSTLSKQDVATHKQAVYHALNNAENGETVVWYNDATDSEGKAFIAWTYPSNGGMCRRVYSYVRIKSNAMSYQDTACLDNNRKTWTFVDKY
jgi:surface antigen